MCAVSMVYDYYQPLFPPLEPIPNTITITQQPDLSELKELIKEFTQALKAAKTVDILTKQPDCADPEKAELEKRVAELERQIKFLSAGDEKTES